MYIYFLNTFYLKPSHPKSPFGLSLSAPDVDESGFAVLCFSVCVFLPSEYVTVTCKMHKQ